MLWRNGPIRMWKKSAGNASLAPPTPTMLFIITSKPSSGCEPRVVAFNPMFLQASTKACASVMFGMYSWKSIRLTGESMSATAFRVAIPKLV